VKIWGVYKGRFPFNRTFLKFVKAANGTEISRNPETVEFPKCEPFKRNSRNSGSKVEWKENFRENYNICPNFRKLEVSEEFGHIMWLIFYLM